jgi:hypothetical protein
MVDESESSLYRLLYVKMQVYNSPIWAAQVFRTSI